MKGKIFIGLAAMCLTVVSCNKDYYDKGRYEEIINYEFPVENVDATHTWTMTSECTADINVNIESGKTYTVKIYEENPISNRTGYVLMQGVVESGQSFIANFSHPQITTTLYVAIVDDSGRTYVTPVTVQRGILSTKINAESMSTMQSTSNKIYDYGFDMAYCFEDSYPQTNDYDFNDVVIGTNTIKNITDEQTTITIDLSLKAVGSTKMMAAALNLASLKEDDIISVECSGDIFSYYQYGLGSSSGSSNNKRPVFPTQQPENGYVVSQLNNSVYIPITNDVHYSINRKTTTTTGMVERTYYNTVMPSQKVIKEDGTIAMDGKDIDAVKGKIVLTLNNNGNAKNITTKHLDFFILEEYNGGIWEVHTFNYKTRPIIYNQGTYEDNIYPWALAVPGKSFRWPGEGVGIGHNKTSGRSQWAYQTPGHSFWQWAVNKNMIQDWYKYPLSNMVY